MKSAELESIADRKSVKSVHESGLPIDKVCKKAAKKSAMDGKKSGISSPNADFADSCRQKSAHSMYFGTSTLTVTQA